MKSSLGIVRNMEPLGRIVIPSEIRRGLDLKTGDEVDIYTNGDMIVLKKHEEKN